MEASMFTGWIYDHLLPHAAALCTAQTAVTDSLLDRVKASYIVDLKHPGQSGDRPDRRNRHQAFDTSMKQRVAAQGTNQCTLGLADSHDGLTADRQQRLQLAADIRVGLHQFLEVADLVELCLL